MKRLTPLLIAGLCALAAPAHAIVINLGSFPQPAGGDSPANELAFLNSTVIPAYNSPTPPAVPPATLLPSALAGSENIQASGQQLSISVDPTGYEFVKFKWGPSWQFYYIAGETGPLTFDSTQFNQNNQPQALSHYTFFNSTLAPAGPGGTPTPGAVPDSGATLALLGISLVTLGFLRRHILPVAS